MSTSWLVAIHSINSALKTAHTLLDKWTRPNPKYIKETPRYEMSAVRNKVIILIQLFSFCLYTIDRLINSTSVQGDLVRWSMSIAICLVLFISCKFHHEIFNIFYTIICISYGPSITSLSEEGIHKAWMTGLHLPMFAYLFTGSFWHFFIQISVHYYQINNIYCKIMLRSVIDMSPEAYVNALVHSTNRTISYAAAFGILLHFILEKAFRRIVALEKKKIEYESQKSFLLSFSHELRNLINSLTGNIKLASLVENISPRIKELLMNAEVCGEVLLHLVNNILDTGKIEIGELEVNPAPTRIYETLEKTWGVCIELIKKQNVHGKMKIQKNIPKTLKIDHFRLTQMLLNLVGNAIKFTDKGSIDISVNWISNTDKLMEKCFQPYPFNEDDHDEGLFEKQKMFSSLDENVLVIDNITRKVQNEPLRYSVETTNPKRGILKVIVSDTGCGMSEEQTKKLFKKFSQVHTDPAKRKMGTGLGLFITKQLCEKMQGEIKVFSKKNNGTSFIFCIPADVIPEEENTERLWDLGYLKNFVASQKLKAMIVDDISFNYTVLNYFFDKLGVEVVEIAVNGQEALKKYKEYSETGNKIDIVTMDLDMPVMGGKEATRRIRQFEAERNMSKSFISIISGNCTESMINECVNKNGVIQADTFIKKPTTLDELLRIIGQHFAHLQRNKTSSL